MTVLEILEDVASSNSRLHKEAVLRANRDNAVLQDAIMLALDPFTQFYIRKIPAYSSEVVNLNLTAAMRALGELSSRRITGNAAIEHLTQILAHCTPADATVIERIIAKDLRCGISDATVNKIWPGLIAEYPCMLASAFDQKLVDRVTWPAIAQVKMDGMRFNALVKNGRVEFRSRNGKEIVLPGTNLVQVFAHMAGFFGTDMVFDGELLVVSETGRTLDRKTGNGILNKAVKGTMTEAEAQQVRATLWDAIPLRDFEQGFYDEAYHIRLSRLSNCVSDAEGSLGQLGHLVSLVQSRNMQSQAQVQQWFSVLLERGEEGVILKTRDGVWENKRSRSLIKFKGELECDLRCVGWEEGTGKNANRLGALVLESDCGGIRVNVGTGFSDADRDGITVSNSVGRIVSVKYNARITDKTSSVGSLFLPVFVEFRDDKNTADRAENIQ